MGMTLVETVTVGSGGAASIEFTSIPQDGVDLLLLVSGRSDKASAVSDLTVRFNSDSTNSYDRVQLVGSGSSVSTYKTPSSEPYLIGPRVPGATATANTFSNDQLIIANYTSSSAKSISQDKVSEDNASTAYQAILAQSWSGTVAITSITIETIGVEELVEHSTASLFKITAD